MKIRPYEAVNDLTFGDDFRKVRSDFGKRYDETKIDFSGKIVWTDYFESEDIMTIYDNNGVLIAVEFFSPEWTLGNNEWSSLTFSQILEYFKNENPDAIAIDPDGFSRTDLGISVGAPDDGGEYPSSLVVYCHAYESYDGPLDLQQKNRQSVKSCCIFISFQRCSKLRWAFVA